MKYSVRKFTALLLALVMVLSIAPLDAVASVFSAYEANIVVDTSESVQISEAIVTSKVTSKDGFSAEVSSGSASLKQRRKKRSRQKQKGRCCLQRKVPEVFRRHLQDGKWDGTTLPYTMQTVMSGSPAPVKRSTYG